MTTLVSPNPSAVRYFPAILCIECDSPIDALIAMCIPRDEAMDLVTAAWPLAAEGPQCLVSVVDGGRPIVALRTPEGRWAGCNAFLDHACSTPDEAERLLSKLLKRGRRGYVAAAILC